MNDLTRAIAGDMWWFVANAIALLLFAGIVAHWVASRRTRLDCDDTRCHDLGHYYQPYDGDAGRVWVCCECGHEATCQPGRVGDPT